MEDPETPGAWYLSFSETAGWLGGAIVPGRNIVEACGNARDLGCNPGGEVMGFGVSITALTGTPEEYVGILLDRDDVRNLHVMFGGDPGEDLSIWKEPS